MVIESRLKRMSRMHQWVVTYLGEDIAMNTKERAMRLVEEAIELCQTEGNTLQMVVDLATHVFNKPVGDPNQEVGGVSVTLLAYCAGKGIDPEEEEQKELNRIWGKPLEHFRERHQKKVDAGVATPMTNLSEACPYCTSNNPAVRTTYYDQTCKGCVERMGRQE